MKFNKAPHPLDVALLCFIAIAFGAQNSPGLIEKLWAGIGSWLWRVFFQTSPFAVVGAPVDCFYLKRFTVKCKEFVIKGKLTWIIHKHLAQNNYSAGPRHREGAERPRRSHVKNPALPEEIAALAPLVRNDYFFHIKSRYELDGSFASVHPRHLFTPHIGLAARVNPASSDRISG